MAGVVLALSVVWEAMLLWVTPPLAWFCSLTLAGPLTFWALAIRLTRGRAVHPPLLTVGDASVEALCVRFTALAAAAWDETERQIWNRLIRIVAFHFGVRPSDLVPQSRFVGERSVPDEILIGLGAV